MAICRVAVYIGIGRLVESDVAVADLHELKSFGAPVWPSSFDVGTPPAMVHTTPVPAHAMQRRNPRRSMPSDPCTKFVIIPPPAHDCGRTHFYSPGIIPAAARVFWNSGARYVTMPRQARNNRHGSGRKLALFEQIRHAASERGVQPGALADAQRPRCRGPGAGGLSARLSFVRRPFRAGCARLAAGHRAQHLFHLAAPARNGSRRWNSTSRRTPSPRMRPMPNRHCYKRRRSAR